MKKNFILLTVLISFFFYLLPAFSENDDLFPPLAAAFENPTRPLVPFDHGKHQEYVNDACKRCHHLYVEGKLVEDGSSDGEPCVTCHPKKNAQGLDLKKAYHKLCRGCHKSMGGPVACGQCHIKR